MRRFIVAVPFVALSGMSACTCGHSGSSEAPEAGTEASPGVEASMPMPEAAADAGARDATVDTGTDGPADAGFDVALPPLSPSTTGAFGIVTVNGKQKMYLPVQTPNDAGNAVIAVVDVGIAGNGVSGAPALITNVDLGTTNFATTTGGTASMIVAASTNSDDVWFIDPSTDEVLSHTNLGSMYGQSGFSGGGGFVTGIAADATMNIAILGVWNGFAVVDLATRMITVIQAPPSENFGYDSVHERILAPFYNCTDSSLNGSPPAACNTPKGPDGGQIMNSGLSVIDLTDNTVYTYEDPSAGDPLNPLSSFPDQAGADPNNQVYVVPAELSGFQNVLDFSKAVFDKATLTVTAPHVFLMNTALVDLHLEDVAIEPNSHLAFFTDESDNDIAVANVLSAAMGDQGCVFAAMPDLPSGGGSFVNLGDPHGIAVATLALEGGTRPVGFLADTRLQWVARIDLQTLQALAEYDAGVEAGTAQVDDAVTYLDATTME